MGGETGITLGIHFKEERIGRDEVCRIFKGRTWSYILMVENSLLYRFPKDVESDFGMAVTFGIRAIAALPGCQDSTDDLWPIWTDGAN